ncbi:translation initiation factor IF-3 [Nakamurella antarctica]|uniref:Translation initiation factor IF-3 n=1 Tax=Nakamurella antarctica TaxID=1902245 RepID=A0A3G8ZK37_9ACTN|nr:translation initiation factor IF-3 [Nakamurella antarctica]AZI57560.1 translation initiation factor IF-3 [Nakamurella antarctica]
MNPARKCWQLTHSLQEDSISVEPRINDRIRVPEVRLVGPDGEMVGIVPIGKALDMAVQADLDLVEVAPTARPPVAKIMDYGKFKYENAQKAREARRNQVLTVIKEMKLRPKIDGHDYETKKGHVVRFLKVGDKVKVTIMFRGREQSRPELGYRLLQRLAGDVAELGFVESAPKQDGRNMIMVLAPHKAPAKTPRAHAEPEVPAKVRGAARMPAPADAPPAMQGENVTSTEADDGTETAVLESTSVETEAVETEAVETEAVESEAVETEGSELANADAENSDSPAVDVGPEVAEPVELKASEAAAAPSLAAPKPTAARTPAPKPAAAKPAAAKPAAAKPAAARTPAPKPAAAKPAAPKPAPKPKPAAKPAATPGN